MSVEELKESIDKYEKQLGFKSLPDSAKEKIQSKLESAKSELAKLESSAKKEIKKDVEKAEPKKTEKKESEKKTAKKPFPKKSKKAEKKQEPEKKSASKLTMEDCVDVLKKYKQDREKKKKSQKKSRSRSTSTRVASNVVQAIDTAIDSVPASDISANPDVEINKFKRLKKAGEEFLSAFKSVLGDDYSRVDIKKEFEEVDKLINELIKKYK
jgi:hypothetical protein